MPISSSRTSRLGPSPTKARSSPAFRATTSGSTRRHRQSRLPTRNSSTSSCPFAIAPPARRRISRRAKIVDGGFLELVRYGIRKPGDPLIEDSVRVIDARPQDRLPGRPLLAALQSRRLRSARRRRPVRRMGPRTAVAVVDRRARALRTRRRPRSEPYLRAMELRERHPAAAGAGLGSARRPPRGSISATRPAARCR